MQFTHDITRKKTISKIGKVLGAILAAATLLLIIIGFSLFQFVTDGHKRSDQELVRHFLKNKAEFQEINQEFITLQGKGLKRIDDNWTDPQNTEDIAISQNDLEYYRKKLNKLSIPRGISAYGSGIRYLSYTSGLAIGGFSQGYLFSENEPKNIYKYEEDLPEKPYTDFRNIKIPQKGSYIIYIKLDENWYCFNEYDD